LRSERYEQLDEAVIRQIHRDPEHATLTFVIKSVPVVHSVSKTADRDDAVVALRSRLEAAERKLEAATALNSELREAGRALREQIAGLRSRARLSDQLQSALDSALQDLAGAFSVRDELLIRLQSADSELRELRKERDALSGTFEKSRTELQSTVNIRNALVTRLHSADRAVGELSKERDVLRGSLEKSRAELQSTVNVRDALVTRLHSADRAVGELSKERDAVRTAFEKSRTELQATLTTLKAQNGTLEKRAERAERTALELTNELLALTNTEIQQLSHLIDVVQRSRFWRVKHVFARLRGLLRR
jgi:chromosome segregation ATPase